MSFVPALAGGGYLGWMMLKRSGNVQKSVYANQAVIKRDEAYFREKIGTIKTAEQLTSDRRLLSVALGAFGLSDDINSRFSIRKVLEDGTITTGALASRLSDRRYHALSAAFGFGDSNTPATQISTFADKIISQWKERGFETAVGQVDETLRLAMNAERELPVIANSSASEATQWYNVMGQRPLRQIFETVFNLPTAFGLLDVEKQKNILSQKAASIFGDSSVKQFSDPAKMENLLRRYLVKSQVNQSGGQSAPGSAALMILSQISARR